MSDLKVVKKGDWWVLMNAEGYYTKTGWKTKKEAEQALKEMEAGE